MTTNPITAMAAGDKDFRKWLAALDRYVFQRTDLHIYDLPDMDWRPHFEAGRKPLEAIRLAAAEEGGAWAQVWAFTQGRLAPGTTISRKGEIE